MLLFNIEFGRGLIEIMGNIELTTANINNFIKISKVVG